MSHDHEMECVDSRLYQIYGRKTIQEKKYKMCGRNVAFECTKQKQKQKSQISTKYFCLNVYFIINEN